MHLQFLGHSIANDPLYGGDLFYNNPDRKASAIESLKQMASEGYVPQCRVPPALLGALNIPLEIENPHPPRFTQDSPQSAQYTSDENNNSIETNDSIIQSCKYCDKKYSRMMKLERTMHCFGIWLHALEYSGPRWEFKTDYPDWANVF